MSAYMDKVVWITGGGSGIGAAMALEFARQGADVAVSGRRAEKLAEVVAGIEKLGRRALAVSCDVTQEASVEGAVSQVVGHFGRLDVAVANAGFSVGGKVEGLGDAEWRRQFDTNVFGALNTIRHALPALRRTSGRMVLIGSVSGLVFMPGFGAYQASKAALRAISATLSAELHGSGVSCTLINPGFVESEIAQVDNTGKFHAERQDKRPMQLMWKAEDAARVIAKAVDGREREYTFTAHGRLGAFLGQHVPGLVHLASRAPQVQAQAQALNKNL